MTQVSFYNEMTDEHGVDEIPDAVISAACNQSYEDNERVVIGYHPVFGWVYRGWEDEAGVSELTKRHICDSSGIID